MNRRDFMKSLGAITVSVSLPVPVPITGMNVGRAEYTAVSMWSSVDGIRWTQEVDPLTARETVKRLLLLYGNAQLKIVREPENVHAN